MSSLRWALPALLLFTLRGCVAYEYEHEFWLHVDRSGTVYVTGRPDLWAAFKALPATGDEEALRRAARDLFESSGLRVRRVTVTHRGGRPYLFVSADFPDVNRLSTTPAFPDLRIGVRARDDRLRLEGSWQPPAVGGRGAATDGLLAVRFHLPSKVYSHDNAVEGVERGNIVGWRETVQEGLAGHPLAFGALIDRRSILLSTVVVFGTAIALALALVGLLLYAVFRRGRRRPA
jgi:hypothetical protein